MVNWETGVQSRTRWGLAKTVSYIEPHDLDVKVGT